MSDEKFRDLQVETLLAYYEADRAEILERLKIRENIAVLYIGAIGAVAGYALGAPLERFYLAHTVIPFLAWGTALLYFQQDQVIDQLSKHCADEICPDIAKLWKEEATSPKEEAAFPLSIDQKLWKKRQRQGRIKDLFDLQIRVAGILFLLMPSFLALIGIFVALWPEMGGGERVTNLEVLPALVVVWFFFLAFTIKEIGVPEDSANSTVKGS